MYGTLFLPLSTMLMSVYLSLYRAFDCEEREIDYKPRTLDKPYYRKLLWYFSHFTFSNSFLLTCYFILKFFNYNYNYNYDNLFITIAPISLSVNLNYFLILYPKRNIRLYELSYYSYVQHLMTTFIILNELSYIEYASAYQIFNYNYFILYGVLITYLNYYMRGIWTYGIANLYTQRGWMLFAQFNIVSLFSSISLYGVKQLF
jgi:hypothetical protein